MASGSFYKYPTGSFGVYCEWSSTPVSGENKSKVTLKTYISYYTINVSSATWTTSVNGESETFTADAVKVSSASAWSKKLLNTRTETITHNSDGTKQITLSASYPFNGTYSGTSIGTITASKTVTLDTIVTKCTAPTSFTLTPNPFEDDVTLKWSGADDGIGNDISSYQIRYRTRSSSTADWSGWTDLTTVSSTSTSGSKTIDMSSRVTRGYYVQFAIRTRGEAGSSYYSSYKESGSIQRQPYTKCTAPTSFTATPNPFETTVKLTWSGAKGGTSNSIISYYIQYCTTEDNVTWGEWVGLKTITSTATSGTYSVDMSSKVGIGKNVKFRIRTQGSAGSSWRSDYAVFSYIQRKPYGNCTAPTSFTATSDVSGKPFESSVKLEWSGAKSGTWNSIASYLIRYRVSSNNSTWGKWTDLPLIESTATSGNTTINMSSYVTRGYYVQFVIKTKGSVGYDSGWTYANDASPMQRNPYTKCTAPTSFTLTSDKGGSNPFESQITLKWSGAVGGTNNAISSYYIQYCTSSDKSTWSAWAEATKVTSTATSDSEVVTFSSLSRSHYIKFRIQVRGSSSAGSSYYSSYKESAYIQRNPYSVCTAPTSITVISESDINGQTHNDIFEKTITLQWSGAGAGSNNAVTGYKIEYQTSDTIDGFGSTWAVRVSKISSTSTSGTYSYDSSLERGKYIRFRITTLGTVDGYNSSVKVSSSIKRNSIPAKINKLNKNVGEFSKGDNIVLSWDKPQDIDDNISYYTIDYTFGSVNDIDDSIDILNYGDTTKWYNLTTVSGKNTLTYTVLGNNACFTNVKNHDGQNDTKCLIQFRVKAVDIFGQSATYYKNCPVITRYDTTDTYIGLNGKWTPCQMFIGVNGEWIEYTVSAGVDGAWKQCGVE